MVLSGTMKNRKNLLETLRFFSLVLAFVGVGCMLWAGGSSVAQSTQEGFSIGVFVPGIVEGSPTYEMMVRAVERAVAEYQARGESAEFHVFEAGFNQAEWPNGLMSLAATARHDLIITSNPSMPEIILSVLPAFPNQKFLVLDGYLEGNPMVKTIAFNQFEQAYLAGYLAGLATLPENGLPGANPARRVALLAGQEYPVMDNEIRPGFIAGARALDPEISLDFRVLGNWYDAAKAADLVRSTIAAGSDVVLTIAGGGNQGAISAAQEAGTYVVWYDASGYEYGPGTVIGSTLILSEDIGYELLLEAMEGRLDYGVADMVGIREGAVSFDFDSPLYAQTLPQSIRDRFEEAFRKFKSGEVLIPSP